MNQIKNQVNEVKNGAKTAQFWIKGTVNSVIGGGMGAAHAFLSNIAAAGLDMDTGELISWKGLLVYSALGAGIKVTLFLKDFKI